MDAALPATTRRWSTLVAAARRWPLQARRAVGAAVDRMQRLRELPPRQKWIARLPAWPRCWHAGGGDGRVQPRTGRRLWRRCSTASVSEKDAGAARGPAAPRMGVPFKIERQQHQHHGAGRSAPASCAWTWPRPACPRARDPGLRIAGQPALRPCRQQQEASTQPAARAGRRPGALHRQSLAGGGRRPRVHLAMPQHRTASSASRSSPPPRWLLKLRPGPCMLDRSQLAGIVHLVSSVRARPVAQGGERDRPGRQRCCRAIANDADGRAGPDPAAAQLHVQQLEKTMLTSSGCNEILEPALGKRQPARHGHGRGRFQPESETRPARTSSPTRSPTSRRGAQPAQR